MFEKSHYETLQDYLASGCTLELTAEELDYYNALYALVGIHRKSSRSAWSGAGHGRCTPKPSTCST